MSKNQKRDPGAVDLNDVEQARARAAQSTIALQNRGQLAGSSPHAPSADTQTAVIGVRLTAKASGLFVLSVSGYAALAAAADTITWSVQTYTDSVAGTPLTLPANAAPAGVNCVEDNSGAGVAPTAGATAAAIPFAAATTLGTAATGDKFTWTGIVGHGPSAITPVAVGETFYATLSIADSVAARAVTEAGISAFELP